MSTAHKTTEEKKEFFDTPQELELKIEQLATWVKESSHFIAFTGAGISTSAGIPDFRSGKDTVLKTGPGAWEKKALGLKHDKKHVAVSSLQAIPTKTHMSMVRLMQLGFLKFLISQNTDGLHRKSGIDPQKFAELHGNTNMEWCKKCKRKYMRDFRTRNNKSVHSHGTGRKCDDPKCRGELQDSIINFGENLPESELQNGFIHAAKADLCLSMGSSLRVTPAADMPLEVAKSGKKLVVVNLQSTPLDKVAALRINGDCEKVSSMLMAKLGLDIPPFILQRYVKIQKKQEAKKSSLIVEGTDMKGNPYSIFPSISVSLGTAKDAKVISIKGGPYVFEVAGKLPEHVNITFNFQGHYGEKPLVFGLAGMSSFKSSHFYFGFNPKTREWEHQYKLGSKGEHLPLGGGQVKKQSAPSEEEKKQEEPPKAKK